MQGVMGCDVLWFVLLVGSVGCNAWSSGWMNSAPPGYPGNPGYSGDEVKALRHLFLSGTRLPAGLNIPGRREEGEEGPPSSEEFNPPPSTPLVDYYASLKRAPGSPYTFGLGKRSRTYKFGLGKRLEEAWKNIPAYRQERRSNMYSFGLGKRVDPWAEDDDEGRMGVENGRGQDKKSKQFSFGLGKRSIKNEEKRS